MNVTAIVSCVVASDLPFVHEALLSIKRQTHPCRVVVVVTEATAKIQASLASLDMDVHFETVALSPPGVTKNLGVQSAATEWVAFLDADDLWLPRKIELQLAHATKNNLLAVGARHLLVDDNKKPFFYGFARTMPFPSTWLIKRELMLREPFSDRREWEDAELWFRFNRGNATGTVRKYLIQYRVHTASLSSTYSGEKRRKERLARAARNPLLRSLFLCASRLISFFYWPITRSEF